MSGKSFFTKQLRVRRWTLTLLSAMLAAGVFCIWGCGGESNPGGNSGNNGGGEGVTYGDDLVYGNQTYKTVVIGSQTWMAENLNYQPTSGNSWCYENSADSCNKYGRLYDWSTAMNISTSYNSSTYGGSDVKHQGVCPLGWHLPSRNEWDILAESVGGQKDYDDYYGWPEWHIWELAGTKLKSKSGWNWNKYDDVSGNGTDNYSFSALPGGSRPSGGYFDDAGYDGNWWVATEYSDYVPAPAYSRRMRYNFGIMFEDEYNKDYGFSVRCVKD